MDKERIASFLHSLETDKYPLLNDIEAHGHELTIPIARRETVSFLQTMAQIKKPASILEVGTAIGFSTLSLAFASPESFITSIEIQEKNYLMACENLERFRALPDCEARYGGAERIRLILGDAGCILPTLAGPYDFIFMDAAKGQYLPWLPEILRLLPPGGLLISDNVLQEETLLESKFAVERRDRTIHKRMRDYLYELKHNEALATSILPLGDGVALSVRR